MISTAAKHAVHRKQSLSREEIPAQNGPAFLRDSVQTVIERDKVELELEKLVFGDEVGFREGLKSYRHGYEPSISSENSENDQQEPSSEKAGELEDIEVVDDADVGEEKYTHFSLFLTQRNHSYFSLIPDHQ